MVIFLQNRNKIGLKRKFVALDLLIEKRSCIYLCGTREKHLPIKNEFSDTQAEYFCSLFWV